MEKKEVTVTEAAKMLGLTVHTVFRAIYEKRLKAYKDNSFKGWRVSIEDLEAYDRNKYSRANSTYNGELLFDEKKGFYSIPQAARMLKVPAQKLYYSVRMGMLKATKKGTAWVIHIEAIEAFKAKYLQQKDEEETA